AVLPATGRYHRRPVSAEIAALIERLATENNGWEYKRIQGELLKVGHRVSASTIRRVLKALKIPPAPERCSDPPASPLADVKDDLLDLDLAVLYQVEAGTGGRCPGPERAGRHPQVQHEQRHEPAPPHRPGRLNFQRDSSEPP